MADTLKTVKSSGGDYSSLSAWDAGQVKTITSGNREIAECYAFEDTTQLEMSAWTVNSGAELIIRAASGNQHTGVLGTGYRIVTGYAAQAIGIPNGLARLTIDGISARNTHASTGRGITGPNMGAGVTIKNCLFVSDNDYAGFFNLAGTTGFINCIFISTNESAFNVGGGVAGTVVYLYNCVLVGLAGDALRGFYGTANLKNTYLHSSGGSAWNDAGGGTINCTTCLHSTAQSITGSTGSTAYSTANFTNVTSGSEDFALVSGSALIDAGTDLSGDASYPFSTDILGATRSGTWEAGPFNYADAATGHPTMRRWGGTPGMTPGPQSFGRGW